MRRFLFGLLLLYTALLPFERFWRILVGQDSVLKPYRIVGLATLGLWLAWLAMSERRPKLDVGDKCYLVIFSWGVVMAFLWNAVDGNDLGYTARAFQLIAFGLAMYFFTKRMSLTFREIELVLSAYLVGLLASVAWGVTVEDVTSGRFRGLQNNPNQLGVAAGIGFIFLLAQFVFAARAKLSGQILRVVLAVTMLALIGFSGSRGAAFGTLAGTILLLVLALRGGVATRRGSSRVVRVVGFATLCLALGIAGFDRFYAAWEETDSRARFNQDYTMQSAGERWDLWRSGFNVGVDHFGFGAGMMQYMSHHVQSVRSLRDKTNDALESHVLGTHSDYVDLFACYGIVGIVAFAHYIAYLLRTLWRQLRRPTDDPSDYMRPLAAGLLAATLVYQISQNSFAWCDYYMVMALVHTVTLLPSSARTHRKTNLALEPRPVVALPAKQLPALRRNQALIHRYGRS